MSNVLYLKTSNATLFGHDASFHVQTLVCVNACNLIHWFRTFPISQVLKVRVSTDIIL